MGDRGSAPTVPAAGAGAITLIARGRIRYRRGGSSNSTSPSFITRMVRPPLRPSFRMSISAPPSRRPSVHPLDGPACVRASTRTSWTARASNGVKASAPPSSRVRANSWPGRRGQGIHRDRERAGPQRHLAPVEAHRILRRAPERAALDRARTNLSQSAMPLPCPRAASRNRARRAGRPRIECAEIEPSVDLGRVDLPASPSRSRAIAAAGSPTGMPRSVASRFIVPNGRMPSVTPPPAAVSAAQAIVPSPPPTTTSRVRPTCRRPPAFRQRSDSGGTNSGAKPACAQLRVERFMRLSGGPEGPGLRAVQDHAHRRSGSRSHHPLARHRLIVSVRRTMLRTGTTHGIKNGRSHSRSRKYRLGRQHGGTASTLPGKASRPADGPGLLICLPRLRPASGRTAAAPAQCPACRLGPADRVIRSWRSFRSPMSIATPITPRSRSATVPSSSDQPVIVGGGSAASSRPAATLPGATACGRRCRWRARCSSARPRS